MSDENYEPKLPLRPAPTHLAPHQAHRFLPNPDREPQEEAKTVRENKLYIAPKHHSLPLSLEQGQRLGDSNRRFHPLFDKFNLGHFYADKNLDPEELALFASSNQVDENNYKTPEREHDNPEKNWGNYKFAGNLSTICSNRPMRLLEGKKSRPKEKGLRKLSQRAYEIVLGMNSASYKQVANRLVAELQNEQELDNEGKDQQNIKRRVYDALNVLIALGVLRKEGRRIVGNRDNLVDFDQGSSQKLAADLAAKQAQIQRKRQLLSIAQQKYKIYAQLAEKHRGQLRDQNNTISFPFLALNQLTRDNITPVKVTDGDCTSLQLHRPKQATKWGTYDIDMLVAFHQIRDKIKQESS